MKTNKCVKLKNCSLLFLPAYICALQREVPYHGRLYITDTHACFYSSVLLKDTKVDLYASPACRSIKSNV